LSLTQVPQPQVIQALFDDTQAQATWLKANLKAAAAVIAPALSPPPPSPLPAMIIVQDFGTDSQHWLEGVVPSHVANYGTGFRC
jgi:hypothetical protein